jgi:hypothetical protein
LEHAQREVLLRISRVGECKTLGASHFELLGANATDGEGRGREVVIVREAAEFGYERRQRPLGGVFGRREHRQGDAGALGDPLSLGRKALR